MLTQNPKSSSVFYFLGWVTSSLYSWQSYSLYTTPEVYNLSIHFVSYMITRYPSEGKTGSSLKGVKSTTEKKTFPKLQVNRYQVRHEFKWMKARILTTTKSNNTKACRESHKTTEYPLIYAAWCFQNTIFVVVILDGLFKTGKSGIKWYQMIPMTRH